jgi:hypothetical protein
LFPSTAESDGAALGRYEQKQIPEGAWIGFVSSKGTEKIWMVWSGQSMTELAGLNSRKDNGEIKDPGQIDKVKSFLTEHSTSELRVEKNDMNKQTNVVGKGKILVHLLKLEHR